MCSDNQLNAKVKLLEIWTGLNIADYPPKIEQQKTNPNRVTTRAEVRENHMKLGLQI